MNDASDHPQVRRGEALENPLRLTAFEEYFFHKDTPDNPSTQCLEVKFNRALDPDLTQQAFTWTCQEHPLLNCRVERIRGAFCWVPMESLPKMEWLTQECAVDELESTHLDVTVGPGIRLVICPVSSGGNPGLVSKIILVVHHSATDGLGALSSMVDFLEAYRRLQQGIPLQSRRNRELLRHRCRSGMKWWERLRCLPGQWMSVRETLRVLSRKTVLLAEGLQPVCPDGRTPRCYTIAFSRAESKRIRRLAAKHGISTNTWALRSLLVSMDDWQIRQQDENSNRSNGERELECRSEQDGSHYRIMVPINERRRSHRAMPACNHCTIVNLDFTREQVRVPSELLEEIQSKLNTISRWRLSLNFWRVLTIFRWFPGVLKKTATREDVSATALLTHVGRLFQKCTESSVGHRDGDTSPRSNRLLAVTDARAFPPLQRGMKLAAALYSFDHQLRISAQFDDRYISRVEMEDLMATVRHALLEEGT